MSLSSLLNPLPSSGRRSSRSASPPSTTPEEDQNHQQPQGHGSPQVTELAHPDNSSDHPSLGSPLDALAVAATTINELPQPVQLAYPSERKSQQPYSPGLEQYHHASHFEDNRKTPDVAFPITTLAPMRQYLPAENTPVAVKSPDASMSHLLHTKEEESLHHNVRGLEDPRRMDDNEQFSRNGQHDGAQGDHKVGLNDQPAIKTESMEGVLSVRDAQSEEIPSQEDAKNSQISADIKRDQSQVTSPSETPMRSQSIPVKVHSSSKKRAAPGTSGKVDKKGTASTIKKPVAKKRKLDSSLIGGTPSSQRSMTPASSRASKTPAPNKRASATPAQSSPVPTNGNDANEEDDEEMEDQEVFCICRKPDDHKWMIGCDGGCEDWFHGTCVNMDVRDEKLVDKYICPNCVKLGRGQTTWKPMCRLEECRQPARLSANNPSKYCSDDHGREFMKIQTEKHNKDATERNTMSAARKRRKNNYTTEIGNGDTNISLDEGEDYTFLRGGLLRASELKQLATGVKDVNEFRNLGEGVLNLPPSAGPDDADVKMEEGGEEWSKEKKVAYTTEEARQMEELQVKKDRLRKKRRALDDREKLLGLVRTRARSVLEELKQKEGQKDICGYDSRLSWSDEEFDIWRASAEGTKALESESLGPPPLVHDGGDVGGQGDGDGKAKEEIGRGVCLKKRCERHKTWFKLQTQDVNFEKDVVRQDMRRLDDEEKGLRERAVLRSLETTCGLAANAATAEGTAA